MKKITWFAITCSIILGLCSFIPPPVENGYTVGGTAMDFSLKNIDEQMISLSDYKNVKGFILIFTCNHCPFSVAYEERIKALDVKYKDQGYPVIAINSNDAVQYPADSYENMKERAAEKQFTFPYLYDETQEIAKAYGAKKTPTVFVLTYQEDHSLLVDYLGAIDDNSDAPEEVKTKYVENAVDLLLAGQKVKLTSTKAIGCGIKWKK